MRKVVSTLVILFLLSMIEPVLMSNVCALTDTLDNAYTNGTVEVTLPVHDIAITDVRTSKSGCSPVPTVGEGYTARINVTVKNQGDFAEMFNVTVYANTTVVEQTISETGLISHWSLDEESGTTAYDSSGNGNNGTLTNGPLWTNGEVGGASSFDGIDDRVQIPDSDLWDFGTGDFAMSAWINTRNQTKTMQIVSAGYGTTETVGSFLWTLGFGYNLGWGSGTRINYATKSGGYYRNYQSNELTYSNNEWAHVAVVKSGSALYFYFNGVSEGSASIAYPSDSNSYLTIGARQWDDFGVYIEFFDGLIDEVKIYNRTLSAAEIWADATQSFGPRAVVRESGASTTLTFTWNTTDFAYGNHTISAYAWPVPDEANTTNNLLADEWVLVSIPGDNNGDGVVDIYDAIRLAGHYNEHVPWPHPQIDPNIDINDDGVIDIYDAILLARHFNQHYP